MNTIRKASIRTAAILLLATMFGCKGESVAPNIPPPGDTIDFGGFYSSKNILAFDSFASDQAVKLYWQTGVGNDPPFLYFKEVRVYRSSSSPDSGFREILWHQGDGEDSTVVDGLDNGSTYYFRVGTYDSTGQLNSVSPPLMTIPGDPEPPGISIPAGQAEWSEWISSISWAHDGTKLAFLKTVSNSINVFVLQISTMSVTQVTNYSGADYRLLSVVWSPDDQWLSYCYTPTRTAGSVDYRIWLISPDGGTSHAITSGRVDASPAWMSPTTLIFTKGTIGPPNIPEFYMVDIADNTSESIITSDQTTRKYDPSLNFSRGLIALRGSLVNPSGQPYLFLLPLIGGVPQPLTSNKYWWDIHPSWSSDGESIYFTSSRSGHYEIWSIDFQSRQLRQVTRSQTRGLERFCGRQAPNGTSLAFLEIGNQFSDATVQITETN